MVDGRGWWCWVGGLPDLAFVLGVHWGTRGASEVLGELLHVGQRAQHPEAARCVVSGRDAQLDRLVAVHCAPGVRSAQPEQLPQSKHSEIYTAKIDTVEYECKEKISCARRRSLNLTKEAV